ncbi:LytR/AlgR family response regulator transcription factor [Saccharopolyspora mangrovi]|uniref:LytTR family DNA-binding domain-containing protein n=1 Tax=Saccharopolyspora mangrovi TaxID=3082379 RepID=A0ABU6AKB7_9PSEU|nr:LytTR family DNA-binding domain-containing protein [Saccharopolyspora sp. S2-29]MEB3372024.1 LytTR family DNA-binding domain-containing protein [Saccharopolyspora sp. S2-29]
MSTRENSAGLVVLAVDDERAGLDEMKFLLGSNPRVGRVLTAFDAAEALRLLRSDDPELIGRRDDDESIVDAVFADVSMPGLSGMELARVLTAFRNPPALVFITGHEENALEAFEVGALDYIMKPANADRVDRALRGIEKNKQQSGQSSAPKPLETPAADDDEVIPVELAGTTRMIPRKEVRWVEAQGDYARLHTTEGSHLVRIPLAQLEERWGEAGFLRIHRSFLVSLTLVTELRMSSSGYSVVLGGGPAKELPVSRRHTRELKDRLVKAPRDNWGQQ